MDSPLHPLVSCIPLACAADSTSNGAACLTNIEQAFFTSCRLLGFDYARFSCWSRFIDDDEQAHYWYSNNFSNYPGVWEAHYEKHALYLHDPVVRIIQEKPESQAAVFGDWSSALAYAVANPLGSNDAEKMDYRRQVDVLYASAAHHDLHHGIYFSCHDGARHVAMSLAKANKSATQDDTRSDSQTLFAIAHLILQSIGLTRGCERCTKSLRIDGMPALQISPTQCRVLQLFLQQPGISVKGAAIQLGIGPDAINYHLKNLRQRLGKQGLSGYALAQFAHELNLL